MNNSVEHAARRRAPTKEAGDYAHHLTWLIPFTSRDLAFLEDLLSGLVNQILPIERIVIAASGLSKDECMRLRRLFEAAFASAEVMNLPFQMPKGFVVNRVIKKIVSRTHCVHIHDADDILYPCKNNTLTHLTKILDPSEILYCGGRIKARAEVDRKSDQLSHTVQENTPCCRVQQSRHFSLDPDLCGVAPHRSDLSAMDLNMDEGLLFGNPTAYIETFRQIKFPLISRGQDQLFALKAQERGLRLVAFRMPLIDYFPSGGGQQLKIQHRILDICFKIARRWRRLLRRLFKNCGAAGTSKRRIIKKICIPKAD